MTEAEIDKQSSAGQMASRPLRNPYVNLDRKKSTSDSIVEWFDLQPIAGIGESLIQLEQDLKNIDRDLAIDLKFLELESALNV